MKRRVKSVLRRYRIAIEDNWRMARDDVSKALLLGLLAIPAAAVVVVGIGIAVIAVVIVLSIVIVALGLVSVVLVLIPPIALIALILSPFFFGVRFLAGHLPLRKRLQYKQL